MKRKITFLIAVIAAIMLITQPMKVLATEWSYTFNASSDIQKGSNTLNSVAWTIDHDSQYSNNEAAGYHVGSSSKPVSYLQASTTGISGTITKIVVNAKGNGSGGTIGVSVNGTAYTAKDNNTSITNTSQNFEFTGSLGGEIIIRLSYSSAISKNFFLSSITVTYSVGATYTVTYNANGGTVGTVPTDATSYANGATVTVKNRNTLDYSSTSPDKGFKGWNTQADGLGTFYHPGATFTMGSSNVNLYAVWTTRCAFAYDDNGADDGDVPDSYYTSYGTGAKVVVLGNTGELEKDAAVWEGWNTTDNGSGTTYQEGDSFIIESNVTLYAKWRELATYALVTKDNPVEPGKHYIIASSKDNGGAYAMGAQKSNNRYAVPVTVSSSIITEPVVDDEDKSGTTLYEFVISGPEVISSTNYYTFYDNDVAELNETSTKTGFLNAPGGSNYLRLLSPESLSDNGRWTIGINETNSVATIVSKTTNKQKNLRYNSSKLFSCYESGQSDVYLYKKVGDNDCDLYSATKIDANKIITGNMKINAGVVTVSENKTLTVNGTLTNSGTAANLIIEDGGQLITSSSVQLTYKKSITSAAKDGGWYTISTPVHTASNTFLTPGSVENLILDPATNYDFFYYDEASHTWMNYKQSAFNLNIGQGYLYRNNGAELHFAGYSNQATYYEKALSYASTEDKLLGFNLIGNPYPQNITMSDVTVNNGGTLSGGYVLSKDGAWSADVAATIAPAQGFLVQIDKTGVTATITKPTGGSKSRANNDYIKFIVANSQHEDAAFALFEEGYGLNKIDHRNSDIPMLYIPKEGHNFAIATMDDNTQSFNLNLKAKTTGKYTLTYKATGNYSYLHVIDRLTGEDVDMLMEGEYSFIASPSDAENRFIVRLEYSNGYENSEDSIFAYQSGSDIIVNGEGELQIFDVMGRRILTQYVSGVETINLQSHGVYIFKLNEKTQKIVVR